MKFALLLLILPLLSLAAGAQTVTTWVPLKSVWKYLDNGSNQGTAWKAPVFDDSTWAQGAAEFGYGDGDEATVVGFGGNVNARYITTYFRKSFTVAGVAAFTSANLRVRRDDGVVIYLNGTEVYRNTMPAGTITSATLASAAVTDEVSLFAGTVSPALLVEGTNVLAVEIHQSAANSSDISFDMDFTGTVAGNTPTANAQSVTATEDTAKAITLTGTDPNGDPLTYSIAAQSSKGVLSGTPPNVTYTPNLNANGADSFTFTVSDGTNVSTAATVSLTVTAVNDAPEANAQSVSVPEDSSVTLTVSGSDVESRYGQLADYTQQLYNSGLTGIADGLSGATFNENRGTLFLIRNDAAAGHSFEYTVDGTLVRTITQSGFVDTEAIAWMYGDTYAIAEENNNQRISIVTIAPGATTLDRTAAGNVTWTTPVGNLVNLGIECLCYDAGRDLLYYAQEKSAGGTWRVYAMNPATGTSAVLCDLNASIGTSGVATDLSDMAFDRATDTILLLSHESSKIIRVSRTGAVLEQRGFTTAFTQAEALALTADRLRMFVGGEPKQFARYALPADTLTYAIVAPPAHGSLSGLPPALTYTPVPNYYGPDSFTFRVSDGMAQSTPATVTLNVTPANDAPFGSSVTTTAEATEPTLIALPAGDPDGDEVTIQTSAPAHGTLTVDGTTVTYTAALYQGPDSFSYTVSDGVLTAGPFTVNISVLQFNNAPVADSAAVSTDEDTAVSVTLTAADAEGDPLTWTVISQPAHGTLNGTAPNLTYSPAADYFGADSFTFRVRDGIENSNTATVSLTINPVNDVPVAQAGSGSIEAGFPLPLVLTGADVEASALSYAIVTPPAHGTLSGTPPNVIYTADITFAGADSFTFTASDASLTSLPAAVSITVAPYNFPPAVQDSSVTTNEDTPVVITVPASDPESQPLSVTILTQPAHGTLSGTMPNLTYVPALNYYGSDTFIWTASDGVRTSAPATCTLTVNPVNDAPVAQAFITVTESDAPVPVTLAGSDPENSPLTFTVVAAPAHGTLSGTAPSLTYVPAAGYTGSDVLTYLANDGALDSPAATVTITITPPVLDTLVTAGSTWKYLDTGTNQGTAWRAPIFDDSAWSAGNAQLGYGDGDEAKVINYGPDANNRYVTTYFRREFQVPNPNVISGTLKLDLLRDDGAVVYLNGTEIARSNMPAGTVAYNTLAPSAVAAPDESAFFSFLVSRTLLVPGRNVLAVEIHQSAVNSSDLSFDLRLYEGATSITRGPYIQVTGTDRATLRWRTDIATTSKLDYGLSTAALTASAVSATLKTEHEITLTGLTPDTRYYYAAGNSTGTLASGSNHYFTTHPPANAARPFRFWVLGDAGSGTASQTAVRDAFYTWNGTQNLDGILLLGDNVYDTGTDAEYQSRFFDVYSTRLRNTTLWPCFGNHDAGSASSTAQSGPYYANFTMPKAGEAGGLASGTEAYYSFDYGNIHFVCLDSEGTGLSGTGAMAQWLLADLAANSREWLVAFWHHPPYSKGSHDSDNPATDSGKMRNMREVFVPILESYGVDLLLFGHEHAYFRSKFVDGHYGLSTSFNDATMLKQTGMGDPAVDGPYVKPDGAHNGAVYTVAGSSGKLDVFSRSMPVLAVNLNELGSMVLDVNGRELTARFLNNSAVVRDTFAIVHNNPPAANALTLNGLEDTGLPVTLAGTDADGDALTYQIVSAPEIGMLSGSAPAFTYTPPPNFQGSTSLQFRVSDGRAWSAAATVVLNITPVNDVPLAAAGSVMTGEDTAVAVPLAASDADGDSLGYTIVTPPAHGTLSGTAPALVYLPAANWHGGDSFAFTAGDSIDTSAPAIFQIIVTAVNDLPSGPPQTFAGVEDTPLPVALVAADPDGDPITWSVTVAPSHGVLTGTAPDLTYTPASDWNGADSFAFTVSDGEGSSAPVVVSITVVPVNDETLAAAATLSTDEDTPLPVSLPATDADGDALVFAVTVPPVHGSLSGIAPNLIYTPGPNWNGIDTFEFTATDGASTSTAVVTVTVAPLNDVPVAAGQAKETAEDAAVEVILTATDADGDTPGYTVTVPPSHGVLTGTAPNLIYTPESNWHGTDSFSFTASDGVVDSVPAVVVLNVTPVNDAPAAAPVTVETGEDTPANIALTGTDADGDPLSVTLLTLPSHGTLSGDLPDVIYAPAADWSGSDSFTYAVTDGMAVSDPVTVTISVSAENDRPIAIGTGVTGAEDEAVAVTLRSADQDDDPLTLVVTLQPAHGTLSGTLPDIIYTPDANWNGLDSFSFTASDSSTTSLPAAVTIEITPVNDAPVASAADVNSEEDSPVAITLVATDADGDAVTFVVTVPPEHGTLSGTAPHLTYTPAPNWYGRDSFTYTASDGQATSPPVVVTLDFRPVNDPPVPSTQSLTTDEDTAVPVTLAATDVDDESLTVTVTVQPGHGLLSGIGPNLTYIPNADFNGFDSFSFTVSDSGGLAVAGIINIEVTAVNDIPVAIGGDVVVTEDTAQPVALTANDADGDDVTVSVTVLPAHGVVTGTAPDFLYTPVANYFGPDRFEFTASDGTGISVPAVITITVSPVNDAPAALAASISGTEDTILPVHLIGTDVEGDALTYTVVAPPAHGRLTGTAPELIYTPDANWNGIDFFSFAVSDGGDSSPPAAVSVTIAAVNDVPVASSVSTETAEDTVAQITLTGTDADGDLLNAVLTVLPAHGILSGVLPDLIYTPDLNWNGTDSFSFIVTDGQSVSLESSATVNVTPANDSPVAAAQSLTGREGEVIEISLSAGDVDGDALTYNVTLPPSHGTLGGTAPDLIYTPAPDWNGLDSFSFSVSDGWETSPPVAVTMEIAPVNDAPVATAALLVTNEDTAVPVVLAGSDSDGDALTYSLTSQPAHGSLSGTAPDILYTPAANWNGTDSFAFTVSDGVLTSAAAVVSITVNAVNDIPVADALAVSVDVNLPAVFALGASDPDGDALTWTILTQPQFGVLSGAAPALTYSPNPAFSGTDSFTFRVSDGTASSLPAVVTLTVAPSGPWQMVARTGGIAPGAAGAAFSALQTDFVSDAAGRASFRASAGSLTGIWTEGSAGLEPAILQGSAAAGATGAVFDAVTTGPWAAGNGEVMVFGKLVTGTGGVTTGNDLGYWLRSGGVSSLVAREDGTVPGMAAAARFSTLSAVATLEAGGNYVFAGTMKTNTALGITAANDTGLWGTFGAPPRLLVREGDAAPGSADGGVFDTLTTASLTSNGLGQFGFANALKIAGSITTANCYGLWLRDPLQFGIVARGGNAAAGTAAGAVFAQPLNPALSGMLAFRSTLSTAGGGVTASNDTGLWSLDTGTVALLAREGFQAPGVAVGGLFANFAEGARGNESGELAFRASLATGGGVTSANNAGVWIRSRFTGNTLALTARKGSPAPGAGSATFASFDHPYLSADGREMFTATLTVSAATGVTTGNDRGLWVRTYGALALALREGSAFTVAPGDVRTVANVTLPAAATAGRTPVSQQGRLLVLLTFTDGSTALYHYTLPVSAVPVASAQALTTLEDTPATVSLSGADADGDALSFAVTTGPAHGVLTGTAPNLTYTPALNWFGTDAFTFTVSDGKNAPVSAQVTLTVNPVNDVPLAATASLVTAEDTEVAGVLAGSDVEGGVLTYSITVPPAHGTLAGAAPAFTYVPAPNYYGPDSFFYTVSDGEVSSAPAVVAVGITPVNDAPLAVAQSLLGPEDGALPVNLNGTDIDGDPLTITLTSLPAHGVLSGTVPNLTFTPDANWHGTDSLAFTVKDGAITSAPATVVLVISAVNDVPVAESLAVRTEENLPVSIELTGSDTDGDALQFSVTTPPANGTLTGAAPHLIYTPRPGWMGSDVFTWQASDGVDASIPAAVTIAVRPVNDAPVAVSQNISTPEDTALPVLLAAPDTEGDAVAFTIQVPPAHGTLSGNAPNLIYTPAADWNGGDSFSFIAFDGEEFSTPASVAITVTAVNDAPVATAVNVITEVGVPVTFDLTGSDVEGSSLAWNVIVPPSFGALAGSGSSRTYTPNLAWSGVDQFTFTVSDGNEVSTAATVTITVGSSGPWQLVARSGNAAPGAAGAAFSVLQSDFVSDAAGRASFRATAGSLTGIWTEGPFGLEPAVLQSAAAPGAAGAVFDAVTTGPWAAGDGELLVFGKLLAGTGGVTTANDLGYWLRSGGASSLVGREDGTVPGMAVAARFSTLSAVATLEAGGNYVFAGTMRTNAALGIAAANDTGLWGTFGAPPRLLVREGDAAPGSADGGVFDTLTTASLTSNGLGQFGFASALKIAGSISSANAYGLWLRDPLQFGIVARGGNSAPGAPAGSVFAQTFNPSLGGSFSFRATMSTASGGVTTGNDTGIWSLDAGTVALLAREGSQAPGIATGGLFANLTEGATANGSGELAFRAALATGGGVTSANNSGVWIRSRYTGSVLSLTARKSSMAPGAGTATFAAFDYPFIAEDGREAFTATLAVNAAAGVTTASDRGLWIRASSGALTLALREGFAFNLAPGDTRTVAAITLPPARTSGRTPLSADARLLVHIAFSDGSSALYHYTAP